MLVGVPKEIKNHEYRIGLTPASVRELTVHGHSVMAEAGLGRAIGLADEQYAAFRAPASSPMRGRSSARPN